LPAGLDHDAIAQQVLALTNQQRAQAGLAPLAPSPALSQAAQAYSSVMAATTCFLHVCGPLPDPGARLVQAGYANWTAYGENIAMGYPSAQAVVDGWMASGEHRANILSPTFTDIGIGLASGAANGALYWTQDFGAQQAASPPADPESDSDSQ
jgi:uncharacterized protein YkwD